MTAICLTVPKFRHMKVVSFVGEKGVVKSFIPDAGSWTYLIEMTLSPKPNFGRLGAETTVMLHEADLRAA